MFVCEFCRKPFETRKAIYSHQRVHSYDCLHCYICSPVQAFYTISALKNHWIVAHEGKRTKCTVCNKLYLREYHLKKHLCIDGLRLSEEAYYLQKVNRMRKERQLIERIDLDTYTSILTSREYFSSADRALYAEHRRLCAPSSKNQPFSDIFLPPITNQMVTTIRESLVSEKIIRTLVSYRKEKIDIRGCDIKTLQGLNWLNEVIIDTYLEMLKLRNDASEDLPSIAYLGTFFYKSLERFGYNSKVTKNMNIFSLDLLFIPLHLEVHWCLAVVDFRTFTISIYDSMSGGNSIPLSAILGFVKKEFEKLHRSDLNEAKMPAFNLINEENIPRQENGSDCGAFTLLYADFLSRNSPFSFTQKDLPYYRTRMSHEIITNTLFNN